MKKTEMNNKGFSLVELIVVIAIMAVLVGVLAPAYLSYVEKSRKQKDESAADEVKRAVETVMSEEDVYSAVQTADGATVEVKDESITSGVDALQVAVLKIVKKSSVKLNSKVHGSGTYTVTVSFDAGDTVNITGKWDDAE